MNKSIFIAIIFLGLFTTAKSQHCGWDNCSVIILDVRDGMTKEVVNDLEIILTDVNGKAYTSEWNLTNFIETSIYQNTDTLKFGQNNGNNSPKHGAYNIPFGVNTYMLLVYYNNYREFNKHGTDKIQINDRQGRYKPTSITFDRGKITHMCTSNPIWYNSESLVNAAITVNLDKKK